MVAMAALGRVERRALHSPILKVDCGSGSTTSTTAAACLGAKLSVFDYFSLGSSLAVRNFGQIGGTLSVLDFLHLGSYAARSMRERTAQSPSCAMAWCESIE